MRSQTSPITACLAAPTPILRVCLSKRRQIKALLVVAVVLLTGVASAGSVSAASASKPLGLPKDMSLDPNTAFKDIPRN